MRNSEAVKKSTATLLGAIAVFALFFIFSQMLPFFPEGDPDRYYHLALARLTSLHGVIHSLPQVDDLGWKDYFPDKEYLFHQLTAWGYSVSGDRGALLLVSVASALIPVTLYFSLVTLLAPVESVGVVLAVLFFSTAFVTRLTLFRPFVFAILGFCVLFLGLIRRWPLATFAGCLFFILSYHAIYLPAGLVVAAWLVNHSPNWKKQAPEIAAVSGLGLGILLNPYFPTNILSGAEEIRVAFAGLGSPAQSLDYGEEIFRLSLLKYALLFSYPIILVLGCGVLAIRLQAVRRRVSWVLLSAVLFWFLTIVTPRAGEYALPLTAVLVGMTLSCFEQRNRRWVALLLLLSAVFNSPTYFELLRNSNADVRRTSLVPEVFKALEFIPTDSEAKIFNCEWFSSPYIFYARPRMRFVDILGPNYLLRFAPEAYKVRKALSDGALKDPIIPLKKLFGADYVLCLNPGLTRQLAASARARLVYSAAPGSTHSSNIRLFALSP